ncbi:MAG: chemotaxis protein CheW, partial [Thermodesulfobacteriota bacterium]|nr:chemotaxis protein CheW [Thermodesulfobacteriota bacterium]
VNRLPGVLSVHGIQEHVLGLINLHGKGIPVIALDRLLKLESGGRDKELFITLKTKNGPLCFLVDELIGFEEIRDDQIRNLKDVAFEFDASYLQFVYFGLNSMVPVLDVNFLTEMRGESGN